MKSHSRLKQKHTGVNMGTRMKTGHGVRCVQYIAAHYTQRARRLLLGLEASQRARRLFWKGSGRVSHPSHAQCVRGAIEDGFTIALPAAVVLPQSASFTRKRKQKTARIKSFFFVVSLVCLYIYTYLTYVIYRYLYYATSGTRYSFQNIAYQTRLGRKRGAPVALRPLWRPPQWP